MSPSSLKSKSSFPTKCSGLTEINIENNTSSILTTTSHFTLFPLLCSWTVVTYVHCWLFLHCCNRFIVLQCCGVCVLFYTLSLWPSQKPNKSQVAQPRSCFCLFFCLFFYLCSHASTESYCVKRFQSLFL